ncbi:hypothetical protein GGR52DRAFT_547958 [Hypoxylon sp. FL1284]|nr:hypothetical protein GGR52DRAFT_547958 [Hypoxylon sp. FL1284]
MSVRRWSLPRRAFTREKSKGTDPTQQNPYPTVHVSNPGTRRHIPSIFASLFDEGENRRDASTAGNNSSTNESQPLSVLIDRVTIPSNLESTKPNQEACRPDTPINSPLRYRKPTQLSAKQDEATHEAHVGTSPNEGNPFLSLLDDDPEYDRSPPSPARVRSPSSSYPSEGLRSSLYQGRSPPLNTWSEGLVSELASYGTYPAQGLLSNSTIFTDHASAPNDTTKQCLMEELAAAGGISDTDTGTNSKDCASKPALSDITSVDSIPRNNIEAARGPTLGVGMYQGTQESIFSREDLPRMLDGHGLSIHGSFPELKPSARNRSSEDYKPYRGNTGSMECLRPSTDTGSSELHRRVQDNRYNTMPASISTNPVGRDHVMFAAPSLDHSQVDGTHSKGSNDPPGIVVQRYRLRKWVGKMCHRTKRRFDNIIKPDALSNMLRRKKSALRRSLRPKRRSRGKKHRFNSANISWPSSSATRGPRESPEEDGRKTHGFIHSLKSRRSMQFLEQDNAGGRRVHSFPP